MRSQKLILQEQLERKLKPFQTTVNIHPPVKGWINGIRTALNMTLEQLGVRLNISKQGMKKMEEREVSGSISINMLKNVAEALGFKFVYGFVPKQGSIQNLIDEKANTLAKKIVLRTHQNMALENQAIPNQSVQKAIDELAYELKREMKRSLWD